jgi:hypothetical protein
MRLCLVPVTGTPLIGQARPTSLACISTACRVVHLGPLVLNHQPAPLIGGELLFVWRDAWVPIFRRVTRIGHTIVTLMPKKRLIRISNGVVTTLIVYDRDLAPGQYSIPFGTGTIELWF